MESLNKDSNLKSIRLGCEIAAACALHYTVNKNSMKDLLPQPKRTRCNEQLTHLEMKDNLPYKAQDDAGIPVGNVARIVVHQFKTWITPRFARK